MTRLSAVKVGWLIVILVALALVITSCKTIVNCPAPAPELLRSAPRAVPPADGTQRAVLVSSARNAAALNKTAAQLDELVAYGKAVCKWED